MRLGELLGLAWAKVDLKSGWLDVHQQLAKPDDSDPKPHLGPLKTKPCNRRLYLEPYQTAMLGGLHSKKARGQMLVFPSAAGGFLNHNNVSGRVLPALLKKAKFDENLLWFHLLRRLGASLLSSHGTPTITIERWLGHSDRNVTADYITTYDRDLADVATTMHGIMAPVWVK